MTISNYYLSQASKYPFYDLWQHLESKDGPLCYQLTYNYELIFKSCCKHRNTDSTSCLPFQSDDYEEYSVLENYIVTTQLCYSPTTSEDGARYSA